MKGLFELAYQPAWLGPGGKVLDRSHVRQSIDNLIDEHLIYLLWTLSSW